MYIRWKSRPSRGTTRWTAELVESRRVNGAPRTTILYRLGSILESEMQQYEPCYEFWRGIYNAFDRVRDADGRRVPWACQETYEPLGRVWNPWTTDMDTGGRHERLRHDGRACDCYQYAQAWHERAIELLDGVAWRPVDFIAERQAFDARWGTTSAGAA